MIDNEKLEKYKSDEDYVKRQLWKQDTYCFNIDEKKIKEFYSSVSKLDLTEGQLKSAADYIGLSDIVFRKFQVIDTNSGFGPIIKCHSVRGFYQARYPLKEQMINLFLDKNTYYIDFNCAELFFLICYCKDNQLIKDINKAKTIGRFWHTMSEQASRECPETSLLDLKEIRRACKIGILGLIYKHTSEELWDIGYHIWNHFYPDTVDFINNYNNELKSESIIQDLFGHEVILDNELHIWNKNRSISSLLKSTFDSFHIEFLKKIYESGLFNIRIPMRDDIIVEFHDLSHKEAKKILTQMVNDILEENGISEIKLKFINISTRF